MKTPILNSNFFLIVLLMLLANGCVNNPGGGMFVTSSGNSTRSTPVSTMSVQEARDQFANALLASDYINFPHGLLSIRLIKIEKVSITSEGFTVTGPIDDELVPGPERHWSGADSKYFAFASLRPHRPGTALSITAHIIIYWQDYQNPALCADALSILMRNRSIANDAPQVYTRKENAVTYQPSPAQPTIANGAPTLTDLAGTYKITTYDDRAQKWEDPQDYDVIKIYSNGRFDDIAINEGGEYDTIDSTIIEITSEGFTTRFSDNSGDSHYYFRRDFPDSIFEKGEIYEGEKMKDQRYKKDGYIFQPSSTTTSSADTPIWTSLSALAGKYVEYDSGEVTGKSFQINADGAVWEDWTQHHSMGIDPVYQGKVINLQSSGFEFDKNNFYSFTFKEGLPQSFFWGKREFRKVQ